MREFRHNLPTKASFIYQSEIFLDGRRDDDLSGLWPGVVQELDVRRLFAAAGPRVRRQTLVLATKVVALRVAVAPEVRQLRKSVPASRP